MGRIQMFILALAVIYFYGCPGPVDGVCCNTRSVSRVPASGCTQAIKGSVAVCNRCGDCSDHGFFSCCGKGACNIFCCNCDGGQCLSGACFNGNALGQSRIDDGQPRDPKQIFAAMDGDKDSKISEPEFAEYINTHSNATKPEEIKAEFKKLCREKRDYLILTDIDADAT